MGIYRNIIGLVAGAAFCASSICGALAEKITYTFTGTGDITGTLGGAAIGGPGETSQLYVCQRYNGRKVV